MLSCVVRTLALILTLNLTLAVAPALAGRPTDVVKGTIDEVTSLLTDPALKSPAKRNQRRHMVKSVIDRHFDYEEMAKRCLGASWRSLNAGQRAEFVRLFGELLEASYYDKIERYTDEKISYTAEDLDEDFAEVRTVILRKNDRIPMDYRLLNKSSDWMVYDVVIEGVSLVSNYRSQFGRVVSESGYGELVRRLRAKVDELKKSERM
jgi:phospholipid transport system substrate-binding protein